MYLSSRSNISIFMLLSLTLNGVSVAEDSYNTESLLRIGMTEVEARSLGITPSRIDTALGLGLTGDQLRKLQEAEVSTPKERARPVTTTESSLDSLYVTGENRTKLENEISQFLIDPDSAQFGTDLLKAKTDSGFCVVGKLNSKNRIGGYTGAKIFFYQVEEGLNGWLVFPSTSDSSSDVKVLEQNITTLKECGDALQEAKALSK